METFKSLRDYVNIIESGGPVSWSSKCVQLDLAANSSDGSSELRLVTGVVEDLSSMHMVGRFYQVMQLTPHIHYCTYIPLNHEQN